MAKEKFKRISLSKEVKGAITVSALAVVLFGGIMVLTNTSDGDVVVNEPVVEPGPDEGTPLPPTTEEEKLLKPFSINAKVERYYFDIADPDKNADSIVFYKGKYTPSTSMEYSFNNTKFDVLASFAGVVTERKVDPLYGYMVYIKNDNGLTAIYGSLDDVKVNVGEHVKQGDIIARAGTNTIDANMSNHLHFALMKDNQLVNPFKYYNTGIKNIT